MKLAIFLTIICVVFAAETSFVEKYQGIFANRRSILSVMTQIESQIKSGGPMDAITSLLDAYVEENQKEQTDHQSLFNSQMEECKSEFDFRNGEIEDGKGALFEAQETLDKCVGQQARAKADLIASEQQLVQVRTQIANLLTLKRDTDYNFETFGVSSKMTLQAIRDSYKFLDDLVTVPGTSLLDLTRHINKMVPNVSYLKQMSQMTPLLSAMAQITMSAKQSGLQLDRSAIEKVRSIMESFEAKLVAKVKKVNNNYIKFVAEYELKFANFQKEQARLVQLVDDLKFELAQLKTCISVQTSNVSSAESKVARNSSLFEKAQRMCSVQEKQFHEQTEARRDELVLIEAIKEKVMQRYGEVSSEVTSRGELTKKQMDNSYVNESAYVKKQFVASK